jgi:hypothetical protein
MRWILRVSGPAIPTIISFISDAIRPARNRRSNGRDEKRDILVASMLCDAEQKAVTAARREAEGAHCGLARPRRSYISVPLFAIRHSACTCFKRKSVVSETQAIASVLRRHC